MQNMDDSLLSADLISELDDSLVDNLDESVEDSLFDSLDEIVITVRIAHLRIAHWGAILRWAILSPSVIRIAHLNYYVFVCLFMLDMGPG